MMHYQNIDLLWTRLGEINGKSFASLSSDEKEEFMIAVHMLFQNHDNMRSGHDILMYANQPGEKSKD